MFARLLKHEFRATARVIPFVYLVTLCVVGLHALADLLGHPAILQLTQTFTALVLSAQILVTLSILVWRFYKSVCSDEGFLTNLLPVKPTSLLLSKILIGWFWVVISQILALGGIMYLIGDSLAPKPNGIIERLTSAFAMVAENAGVARNAGWILLVLFVAQLLAAILSLEMVYLAILAGMSPKLRRTGVFGILAVGVAEYSILQAAMIGAILTVPLSIRFVIENDKITSMRFLFEQADMLLLREMFRSDLADQIPISIGLGSWVLLPFVIILLFVLLNLMMRRKTHLR